MDGILNVCKPIGPTSHDVVATVRRLSGQKRVGHAGTLDPAACGVLIVCLGRATRLLEYMSEHDKEYCAEVRLGFATDSYDTAGQPTTPPTEPSFSLEQVEAALRSFIGPQLQSPPPFSAVKVQGTAAHRLARAGHPVQLQPREVEVYALDVVDWQPPHLTLFVRCSKGTYIRSLAHDLGQRLGCGAHLSGLVRLASGPFRLEDAASLDQLQVGFTGGFAEQYLYAPDEALLSRPAVVLSDASVAAIEQGQRWQGPPAPPGQSVCRAYSTDGRLVAVLQAEDTPGLWHPRKVLSVGR